MTAAALHPDATRPAPGRVRRTQAERREATRQRLMEATVDCLAELGFAGTTTTAVAERSGLSRGAQLHHFPTKAELVAAAVEHVFDLRVEEFRARFGDAAHRPDRLAAAVDLVWELYQGPTFAAYVEVCAAARTDAELGALVGGLTDRFQARLRDTFVELFPELAAMDDVVFLLFCLLDGLGLARMTGSDTAAAGTATVLHRIRQLTSLVELAAPHGGELPLTDLPLTGSVPTDPRTPSDPGGRT